ncbi:E3 ubiquitin/ISG15 ligase TRIM25-like [Mytilus trossulus]|uniref:E3 ubiquitin/ISG15 ligase TRIM25-like n=1 Tax=Mytilus trossulus TaxID=6551 RepID=UPI003004C2D1
MDKQADSKCKPCSIRGSKKDASVWCTVCKEGLCSTCQKYHSSFKPLRLHGIVPFDKREQVPQIFKHVMESCSYHERSFELYCPEHQEPCCIRCTTNNHKGCKGLCPIDDVIENVKSSVAINRIDEGFSGLILKIEQIMENKEQSKRDIADQIKKIKKEIINTKKKVEEKIDGLIKQQFDNIERMTKEYDRTTSEGIQKLKAKLEDVQDIKTNIQQSTEQGNNLQVFLSLSEFESILSKQETFLSESIEKGEFDNADLIFSETEEFKSLMSFGEICHIELKKQPLEVKLRSSGQIAKVQIKPTKKATRHIDTIKIIKSKEASFRSPCLLTGCVILQNDSILFANNDIKSHRLFLYDCNCRFLRDIETASRPFDIAIIDESVVAVTMPEAKKVSFIDFSKDQEQTVKELDVIGECYGIDHSNNKLAVAVKGYGVQIFDATGTQIKTIPVASQYIVFDGSFLYHADSDSNVLKCCDYEGKHVWEITIPGDQSTLSMALDIHKNIYVVARTSYKLYIVSSDGSKHRQLLQKSDGLYYPQGVFYDKRKQQLVLCANPYSSSIIYSID